MENFLSLFPKLHALALSPMSMYRSLDENYYDDVLCKSVNVAEIVDQCKLRQSCIPEARCSLAHCSIDRCDWSYEIQNLVMDS